MKDRAHQCRVIMFEDFGSVSTVIVKVLDDVGIVQIDRCRDPGGVRKKIIRDVPLNDCCSALAARAGDGFGRNAIRPASRNAASIGAQKRDALPVIEQRPCDLEKPDADPGGMAVTKWLGADEKNPIVRADRG